VRQTQDQNDLLSMRVVAAVWMRGRSGMVRSGNQAGRALVADGRAVHKADFEWLQRALRAGDLSFRPVETFGGGTAWPLHQMLWELALTRAKPTAVLANLDAALVVQCPAQRLRELPLSGPMRGLLAAPNHPRETLRGVCRSAQVPAAEVARELSALIVLRAARLRAAAGQAPRPVRAPVRAPARPAAKRVVGDPRVVARLKREWSVIQDADDWTVIGASASMSPDTVSRACARMQLRYAKLAKDERLGAEGQALAGQIAARVNEAVQRIQRGDARAGVHATPLQLLAEAKRLCEQRKWDDATKKLMVARKRTHDPDVLAWLGWAVLHTGPGRAQAGEEKLRLADSMGSVEAGYLLAQRDVETGDLVRAWTRLETVVRDNPNHADAVALLGRVKGQVKRA
jgi:hypothetical protein